MSDSVYEIDAYVNVIPSLMGLTHGYVPGDQLALVRNYRVTATSRDQAAEIMFAIGNHQAFDSASQGWPTDVRSLAIGDVIKVDDPHGTVWLANGPIGFVPIEQPNEGQLVPLAGTEAVRKR